MYKEDILKRSREENKFLDERERQEIKNGFGFGGVLVGLFCAIFSIIKAVNGEHFFEFGVIIFGYLVGIAWYNYKITKKKTYLIQATVCGFAIMIGLIGFFLLG